MKTSYVEEAVERALAAVGKRVVLGLPLGLGKPVQLANAFYQRAKSDASIQLEILTALTLRRPTGRSGLERRLVDPLAERLFGGYPEPLWETDLDRGSLPANVKVTDFFFRAGTRLGNAAAQRGHLNANYTHVVRDALTRGINVFAQLVAAEEGPSGTSYSLSCNPDITLDLLPRLRASGRPTFVLAQVHSKLPYMYGEAELGPEAFDVVLESPDLDFELFAPPNEAVDTAAHLLGLQAAALVRDGGTLQLGIGALADAVTHMLQLRHERPNEYGALLESTGAGERSREAIEALGGAAPFREGLYAASEMLADGFLDLFRSGILTRRVDGAGSPAVAHAAFFLGPRAFYEELRSMPAAKRRLFRMTAVSFVNDITEDYERKAAQRRAARFINSALKVTLGGAIASDALETGQVVSGVGGQYNFVAMAHALSDGRAVMLVRSTRKRRGRLESNIVLRYGHVTIPRHLRDVVVTEYGVADLRGRTDEEVHAALIQVADSRFQESLRAQAVAARKLDPKWRVPERFRRNTPERLEDGLAAARARGLVSEYPYGTDLSHDERVLARALGRLKNDSIGLPRFRDLRYVLRPPASASPYLRRMRLERPADFSERWQRRLLLLALARDEARAEARNA